MNHENYYNLIKLAGLNHSQKLMQTIRAIASGGSATPKTFSRIRKAVDSGAIRLPKGFFFEGNTIRDFSAVPERLWPSNLENFIATSTKGVRGSGTGLPLKDVRKLRAFARRGKIPSDMFFRHDLDMMDRMHTAHRLGLRQKALDDLSSEATRIFPEGIPSSIQNKLTSAKSTLQQRWDRIGMKGSPVKSEDVYLKNPDFNKEFSLARFNSEHEIYRTPYPGWSKHPGIVGSGIVTAKR